MKPSKQEILSRLRYEPDTGYFYWATKKDFGKRAGAVCTKGYIQIKFLGISYMAHHFAWVVSTGNWPAQQIDHINNIKHDNRIANLRDVSQNINLLNQKKAQRSNKSSGVLGVHSWRGRWAAHIRVNNKLIRVGVYDTIPEASAAYIKAKSDLTGGIL